MRRTLVGLDRYHVGTVNFDEPPDLSNMGMSKPGIPGVGR